MIEMEHIKYKMAYGVAILPMNSFKSWNSKSNLSSDATKVIFWKNYFNSCFRKGVRNLTILKGGDVKRKWNHAGETSAFYSTQIISFLKNVVKAWKTWTLLTFRDSINNSIIARLRDLQDFVPLKYNLPEITMQDSFS